MDQTVSLEWFKLVYVVAVEINAFIILYSIRNLSSHRNERVIALSRLANLARWLTNVTDVSVGKS